ncbi:PilZ domain-containing protein [Pseudobacteriovorax antillogorgiicola]|uniref:PilZ domain-containing protein n=1 Tax=Pseudobacteriovorax antillogorgiicola TaxID=1513793 RepID=A0A1Y6B401_9BACT|nr:PilZ domain-containing protein [Pseudobacteriovorax antillogorgiicola]TCS59207.1 PilZ domain-containing protein [Pseudobacteriovorax antillogorgiicola]SME90576.1 PilZ domain-containing protein [Pseudobacteriovorax antillogorgiicola]
MSSESKPIQKIAKNRAQRYISHALVEVRRFKLLPFFCDSAVLLDISIGGFKLEFTGEIKVVPGNQYWLNIPLSPLGIYAPKRLICKSECRWFDDTRYRIGGTFIDLTKTEQMLIEQIVSSLKSRGQL